jgi:hypothetical protein
VMEILLPKVRASFQMTGMKNRSVIADCLI